MIFVTGPLYSGKKTYVKTRFGWNDAQLARLAAADVQKQLVTGAETPAQLEALAAQLAQKTAVTAAEVGSGVVPIDKAQRAQREAAGRLAILLAQQAQEVVRVFCGIPTRIK